MLQKFLITLFAFIAVLFLALFSPYTSFAADAVANDKCANIKLLNKEWQKWCGSQGWGTDANGRWVQMKGKNKLKTPGVAGGAKKKVPEQKIYWTQGKRIRPDHIDQTPKGGWR